MDRHNRLSSSPHEGTEVGAMNDPDGWQLPGTEQTSGGHGPWPHPERPEVAPLGAKAEHPGVGRVESRKLVGEPPYVLRDSGPAAPVPAAVDQQTFDKRISTRSRCESISVVRLPCPAPDWPESWRS